MGINNKKLKIKKPTIFFIILDFLTSLVLCIVLLNVEESGDYDTYVLERKGRIIIITVFFARVIFSCFAEWVRSVVIKPNLVDTRISFKIYLIIRYIYVVLTVPTSITIAYCMMRLNLLVLYVILGLTFFEEAFIVLVIGIRVLCAQKSLKMEYFDWIMKNVKDVTLSSK